MASLSTTQDYFIKCCTELSEAEMEWSRLKVLVVAAGERRDRLVMARTNAWGELQMAKAEASAKIPAKVET